MSSTRTSLPLLAFGALAFGALTLAAPAQAQSCDPDRVHSSYPTDGATAVPTNTAIYVYGPELAVSSHDVALEAASGAAVEDLDVRATEGGLLVEPIFGLSPSTRYELTLAPRGGGAAWSTSFTTGAGPATAVQLEAPDVTVSVINRDNGACGEVSAICVIGSVPERMTLEVLVGDEVLSLGGGQPAPAYPASGGTVASNECVEVRVREPGGFVSETTRVCGDDIERFESDSAPTSCLSLGEADDDEESGGGCSLGTAGAASGGAGLVLLLGALLGLRRRPRAR